MLCTLMGVPMVEGRKPTVIIQLARTLDVPAFANMYNSYLESTVLRSVSIGRFTAVIGEFEQDLIKSCYLNNAVVSITYDKGTRVQGVVQHFAPSHLVHLNSPLLHHQVLDFTMNSSSISRSRNTNFYLLDTGVSPEHADFTQRVKPAKDITSNGDDNGHGNSIASLVLGETMGVSKTSVLHSFKCIGDGGVGFFSDVLLSLNEICSNDLLYPKGVILLPFVIDGLGSSDSLIFDLVLEQIKLQGFLIIAPAGNFNSNACLYSPGNSKHVLTVGSIDPISNEVSSFSNFGPCVDIYANGVNLLTIHNDTHLEYKSGTSMSMALVAGVVGTFFNDPVDSITKLKNLATASRDYLILNL